MKIGCAVLAAVLSACGVLATAAQAEIYKWVDERGVTQYGERAPADVKASTVAVPAPPPTARKPVESGPEDWAAYEIQFRRRQIQRAEAAAEEQQKKYVKEDVCRRARNDLAYQSGPAHYWVTNEKGERVYRTDEQQAGVVEAARRRVNQVC